MSGVDELFGSDDEEPQQAPKAQTMKEKLAALAAAKKRERVRGGGRQLRPALHGRQRPRWPAAHGTAAAAGTAPAPLTPLPAPHATPAGGGGGD